METRLSFTMWYMVVGEDIGVFESSDVLEDDCCRRTAHLKSSNLEAIQIGHRETIERIHDLFDVSVC